MAAKRRGSPRDAQVIALHATGRPYSQLAKEMGICKNAFASAAFRLGLKGRTSPIRALPADCTEKIIELRKAGLSSRGVSKALGVSVKTINTRLRQALGPAHGRDLRPARERGSVDGERHPYPAGHPVTWGLISHTPWALTATPWR